MAWRDFKDYFRAVGSTWVGLMSSIVGLILLGLGFVFSLSGLTQFRYWLTASIICFAVASFKAWQKHRPDLIIEIKTVVLDTNYGGMIVRSETSSLHQFVTLMLYLSNTRPEDNSVRSYRLIVEGYGRTQEGEGFDCDGFYNPDTYETCLDLNKHKRTPLKQGVPVEGCVRFLLGREPHVKGHRYTLIVTDAYNVSRKIKGTLPLDYSRGLLRVKPDSGVTFNF